MSCHNATPDLVLGSENKYHSVPQGIDCERCHGPGELHVQRMMNGEIVDTSKNIDYSIVNPKKLSLEAQFQICMRCHLQGNTVLEEGKSFLDFKPGMELSEVMTVFVPRYEDDNTFIMASHVDRFKQSACFTNSEMNCITCHNPHHSVKKESPNFFNNKCLSCHDDCKDEFREGNNCVECHMPSSSTIDIPHVSIHDHKIGIHNNIDSIQTKGQFIGLEAINNANPSKLIRAKAYLYQYEKFDAQNYLLDSAITLLNAIPLEESYQERIHLYYLKKDDISIINVANSVDDLSLDKMTYYNADAWTAYRIAQAYQNQGLNKQSLQFYKISVGLSPYILDFRLKLADMYSLLQLYPEAEIEYRALLAEFSKHENAWCNLGYVLLQQGQDVAALDCYDRALKLNPQHIQSLLNKASLMILKGEINKGKLYLNRILDIDPENAKVKYLLSTL
jgi:tetratricopeptide (TPR) repeat protein